MKRFLLWQRWLLVVGMLITVFGLVMAFLNGTPVFQVFNRQIDPVFWGTDGMPEAATQFRSWAYGVWGATVAGWGVVVIFIAQYPFRRKERWARDGLAAGIGLWYVVDTALSMAFDVYFNAIFNSVLLLLVALPLALTWWSFRSEEV